MLRHDGQINEVVVGEVLHIMGVALRTIVALPHPNGLSDTVVVKSGHTADNEDYLSVALMLMDAARGTGTEGRIHNLHLVVGKVPRIQRPFTALEVHLMNLRNLVEIYNHNSLSL